MSSIKLDRKVVRTTPNHPLFYLLFHLKYMIDIQGLPSSLFDELEIIKQDPELRLILLTGSYARGDQKRYSDIDIYCLMAQPNHRYAPYTLEYHDGRLVSLSFSTIREWEEALERMDTAAYLKPAILDAKVIYEHTPQLFSNLRKRAENTKMEDFGALKDELLEKKVVGYLEEFHKLLNGVYYAEEHLILYGILGINLAGMEILSVRFDMEFKTENVVFDDLNRVMERIDDDMRENWRVMWGLDQSQDILIRGVAAIRYYLTIIQICRNFVGPSSINKLDQAMKFGYETIEHVIRET